MAVAVGEAAGAAVSDMGSSCCGCRRSRARKTVAHTGTRCSALASRLPIACPAHSVVACLEGLEQESRETGVLRRVEWKREKREKVERVTVQYRRMSIHSCFVERRTQRTEQRGATTQGVRTTGAEAGGRDRGSQGDGTRSQEIKRRGGEATRHADPVTNKREAAAGVEVALASQSRLLSSCGTRSDLLTP